jgi:SOS-response transcriptional repressor LexA
MSTLPLTEKQERLWRFIKSCERSPTYDEMAVALGHKVKGQRVFDAIGALEAKGFVKRLPGRARSIVALDPALSLKSFSNSELLAELEQRGIRLVPLTGCVA